MVEVPDSVIIGRGVEMSAMDIALLVLFSVGIVLASCGLCALYAMRQRRQTRVYADERGPAYREKYHPR